VVEALIPAAPTTGVALIPAAPGYGVSLISADPGLGVALIPAAPQEVVALISAAPSNGVALIPAAPVHDVALATAASGLGEALIPAALLEADAQATAARPIGDAPIRVAPFIGDATSSVAPISVGTPSAVQATATPVIAPDFYRPVELPPAILPLADARAFNDPAELGENRVMFAQEVTFTAGAGITNIHALRGSLLRGINVPDIEHCLHAPELDAYLMFFTMTLSRFPSTTTRASIIVALLELCMLRVINRTVSHE